MFLTRWIIDGPTTLINCWSLQLCVKYIRSDNNSNIIIIIISKTMFMVLSSWQSHCESLRGSFDECRTAPSGRLPNTKLDDLGCESACTGCQNLHPPLPFIIITQPKSWYSFYRPREGRRLSRPSWLITYRYGLPVHRRSPIHLGTNRVWRSATTLIKANALPLSQTANRRHKSMITVAVILTVKYF